MGGVRIAVLGWGSLLWDPRKLKLASQWAITDLCLPLEFSRKSARNRLTLVVDPVHGQDVLIACALSGCGTIRGAVGNLTKREGCDQSDIGVATPKQVVRGRLPMAERVRAWVEQACYDAVIWTDLESNFSFTVKAALAFLGAPRSRALSEARTYIALSPAVVETPLRARLRSSNWLGCTKTRRLLPSQRRRPRG
jgi:hypothetical protein